MRTVVSIFALIILTGAGFPDGAVSISLPPPVTAGGKPLMQCLKQRHSSREFSGRPLPLPVLSSLLWAANGINREDGHRTAPSAMNNQETLLYVFLQDGVYRYDESVHSLIPVLIGDYRAATGKQEFVKDAPLNLVYVADRSRMHNVSGVDREFYAAADAGFIAQNVYLYCASEGLNCVVRGWVDRAGVAALLGLKDQQHVVLAQTAGYPPE